MEECKIGSKQRIALKHSDFSMLFIRDLFYLNEITQQLHRIKKKQIIICSE